MVRRLVIFLVRKKLGLKLFEPFRFVNQKTDAVYLFTKHELLKDEGVISAAGVSLNWLLHDECEIQKLIFDKGGNVVEGFKIHS